MKKENILKISILITIIKILLLVPIHVSGGLSGKISYNTYSNLISIKLNHMILTADGFYYTIIINKYIIENIIVFIASLLISYIIYKLLKKEG